MDDVDQDSLNRLADVLRHLPPGPFTRNTFLVHAIGLNAIDNASQVDLILARLASLNLTHRFGSGLDTWVVMNPAPAAQLQQPAAMPPADAMSSH